ncbi:MAG: phage integrase N-terminal SAM-like domain-containing protein [Rhodoferax sp.]|nr:phage integrase N-terminal SAM-like domain-containing protein [Rhodoferax sp.]
MNPVVYLPQSRRLLEQVREVLRYKHYSLKTEQAYLYWIRFYVRWHGRHGQMQHPRDMGGAEVTCFCIGTCWSHSVRVICYIFNSYSRISDGG